MALLPTLSGDDHRRAAGALVESVLREGYFITSAARWDLLPDDALAPLLLRLRDDPYGWNRDDVIEHVIETRTPELVDRCLQPLLDRLSELEPDARLETVTAMTPWLADRSEGAIPRVLAELPVPSPNRRSNPLYPIARVLDHETDPR